jgi:hypothetical protein
VGRANSLVVAVATVLLAVSIAFGQTERAVMLIVTGPVSGWPDGELREKLTRLFSMRNDFRLLSDDKADAVRDKLENRFNKQGLVADGQASKYRYVVWCDIIKQELRVDKGFNLPLLVNQRRVSAAIEVDYQIVDCYRGRIVASDRVVLRRNGPSSTQILEDTDADPSLLLSYPQKKEVFDKLETEAAAKLLLAFVDIAKQR